MDSCAKFEKKKILQAFIRYHIHVLQEWGRRMDRHPENTMPQTLAIY